MKKFGIVRVLLSVWAVATLYFMLSLWSRANLDEVGGLLLQQPQPLQPHAPHSLNRADDPVLHRRQVVEEFQRRHLGPAQPRPTDDRLPAPMNAPNTQNALIGRPASTALTVVRDSPLSNSQIKTGWPSYFKYKVVGDVGRIWPKLHDEIEDRILNQLHLVQPHGQKLKKILLFSGLNGKEPGQKHFRDHRCPVDQCTLTSKHEDAESADLILFEQYVSIPSVHRRRPSQIWVLFMLEPPYATPGLDEFAGLVNWTATYRIDSTLVAPYEIYTYFNNYTGQLPAQPPRDFWAGKSKMAAWFVSNCAPPSGRNRYVDELKKHLGAVDIRGACGTSHCPRSNENACCEMLRKDFFFYLSFESQICQDYITEKLFWRALLCDVIPVVMGGTRAQYERRAPPESFIHVDDFSSPQELSAFLRALAADNDRYNSYFRWKGTGEYIDTKFWCRLCGMLHESHRTGHHSVYDRLEDWWRGPGACRDPGPNGWASWRGANGTSRAGRVFHREWTEPVQST